MRMFKFFLVLFVGAMLASCAQEQKEIVIYGANSCWHCKKFKKHLDADGFEYTFHDVEFSNPLQQEMLDVVKASGYRGRINYPVVVISGEVHIAPEYETVKPKLN
ncbi:MAG: hypothetical protein JXQ90_02000 [Cyclobacteriaceae bacterium]